MAKSALLVACFVGAQAASGNNTINLLWPGSSWASIACGTQYQMLAAQGYKVGHIMGASGGAASAVMTLADPNASSMQVLKDTYTKYGKKCDLTTSCWAGVYQNLLETIPGAFERVRQFGKVSLVCGGVFDSKHYVLYNFTDAEQAGQAYAASGGSGEVKGIGSCRDGGSVKQQFPPALQADHTAYFATTSAEGASGAKTFPLFCPHSIEPILAYGYDCIPFLTDPAQIHPQDYTVLDGAIGTKAYGSGSIWRDCGLPQ